MDPKVLLNIAVEELGAVPDGQSYVVEQFQVRVRFIACYLDQHRARSRIASNAPQ